MPNRETKVLTEYSIAPLADLNAKSARLFSAGFSSDPKKYLSRVFRFDFSRRCWAGTSLLFLALLGGLAESAGGVAVMLGAMPVTFWGALAVALTAGVGSLFGTDA